MRLLLLLLISGILLCILLAGCAIAPIRDTGDAADAPTIAQSLGSSSTAGGDGGKQLASETGTDAITETVPAEVPLSTPELIEAAYLSGAITDGERILYLAYAIYDYEELPAAYQSATPWRGTMYVQEIKESVASPEFCAFGLEIQEELRRLLADSVEFSACS